MGVRHRTRPVLGVQWHPESICSSHGIDIINNFRAIVNDFWHSGRDRTTRVSSSLGYEDVFGHVSNNLGTLVGSSSQSRLTARIVKPAYCIKAVHLGSGPTPEVVFDTLVRGSTRDGEAWLDSAKVRLLP
jgi:para-aminobenzoate synthetase